jgi:hypothetical protein
MFNMQATFEPQELKKGWFLRTLKQAIKLCFNNPFRWLALYVVPVATTVCFKPIIFSMFVAGSVSIIGTAYCVKIENKAEQSLKANILKSLWPWVILTTACTMYFFIISNLHGSDALTLPMSSGVWDLIFRFSVGGINLLLMIFLISMPALLLRAIYTVIYVFSGKEFHFSLFSVFAYHITIDTEMGWFEACKLSSKAVDKNMNHIWLSGFVMYLSFLFPMGMMIFIPWLYFVYREIFWGPIKDMKPREVNAKAAIPFRRSAEKPI